MLKSIFAAIFLSLSAQNTTIAQDTTNTFISGTTKLFLLKDSTFRLRSFAVNEISGGWCVLSGTYQFIRDSMALLHKVYYAKPTTQIIDTFNRNPTVRLIVTNERLKKRVIKVNLYSGKAIVQFLPVGVENNFKITTERTRAFSCEFSLESLLFPKASCVFYLPYSKRKTIRLHFYEPGSRLLREDVSYFKVEKGILSKIVKLGNAQTTYIAE